MTFEQQVSALGKWYHRINLGDVWTPGDRNQELTFRLYEPYLPDLRDLTVLDLGANAGGLSVEFAKRGAHVTALEGSPVYCEQARFVINHLGLSDRVAVVQDDVYSALDFGEFDIVCYVGLSYHLRYPQLAFDMLSWCCRGTLLASSQTIEGSDLTLRNRAERTKNRSRGELYGWEPTESLLLEMIHHAGFNDAQLLSTAPHPGEHPGNILGNRSYVIARAGSRTPLPFVSKNFYGKPENTWRRR